MAQAFASVQVFGLKELDTALRELPEEVSAHILGEALGAAGDVVLQAAKANIHGRTGRTAADLRAEVQSQPDKGAAAIGGTRKGKSGRAHVLRWLEFGGVGKKHGGHGWPIIAGARARRVLKTKIRRAVRNRDIAGAVALAKGASIKKALTLPGGRLRASVHHPGFRPQSPLTLALVSHGDRALTEFISTLRRGIVMAANRLRRGA